MIEFFEEDVVVAGLRGFQVICAQLRCEFCGAIEGIEVVDVFHQVCCDGRVVGNVLTEEFGAIVEKTFKCFAEDGVERLELASAEVHSGDCKCDAVFESF